MTVRSYLVHPLPGARPRVEQRLRADQRCEVWPARNHDLLVVIAESADRDSEEAFDTYLRGLDGVGCVAFVSALTE